MAGERGLPNLINRTKVDCENCDGIGKLSKYLNVMSYI